MGELIYCEKPLAAAPFFIEDANLNIYSTEELSYYIQNNVYLLSADLMSTELINWIGREADEKELSKELLGLVQSGAPLHSFVEKILVSNGYLTQKEIKNTITVIKTFENKSEAEVRKIRADRLMDKKRYVEAIHEYEAILFPDRKKDIEVNVEGDIRHNLGTAYARLFFFEEAAASFEKAYLKNHRVPSLMMLLLCYKMMKREDLLKETAAKYHVPDEQVKNISDRVFFEENKDEPLKDVKAAKEEVLRFKSEYGKMSGI
ncbi:MAG: hypothetical protein IIZ61_02705 [Lachnospiraceae bacterium]|nr:hypothetical protein [Lachnospiraceae bacterium]